ncbi:MAG: MFS transporter, partial [Neisseriaceae bacterium]|nr:MFS transporter [Neisseriaceae bacterium]
MSESQQGAVNVQHFINEHRFSGFQWLIFILCFLVTLFDGFDTAAIGYVAPSLLGEWGLEKADLAPVMSAALLGLAFGAVSFGPVADMIGRKKVLIVSVMIFALGSWASAEASSLLQLEIFRFITGVGLGAAMPNAVTLLSEYCPEKRRFFLVNTMFCGFPVGAAMGGFLAAWMIPEFGWRSVLWLGAVAPAILVVVMLLVLPESVRYLVAKNKPHAQVKKILQKISPAAQQAQRFFLTETQPELEGNKSGISVVVSKHYLLGSVMLWVTYFMGLVIFYGVINWMPLLFKEANMPPALGSVVTGLFALGGLGAIANGWLMDRYNPSRLITFFWVLTAILVALIGVVANMNISLLVVVIVLAGIVMNTAQSSMPSFAASFYPTSGRTTGVSWMLGIGRFGGIAGSFLVAQLIARHLDLTSIFFILAIPAAISAVALIVKGLFYKP